jgi:hypothetical protein
MKRLLLMLITMTGFAAGSTVRALDHGNLDAGRPLRLQDAYAIDIGEWALEAGAGFIEERRRGDQGFFPVQLLYGAPRNVQVGLGGALFTKPGDVDETVRSGDVELEALYNLNQETLWTPAFGLAAGVNLPTGKDSQGTDFNLTGLLTKSLNRLSLHVNAGYGLLKEDGTAARDNRYELVAGASYPLGAPMHTRTTVLADFFTEQSAAKGLAETNGAELGLRRQLTPRSVWDVGIGTELSGPEDRADFFLTTGLSVGF